MFICHDIAFIQNYRYLTVWRLWAFYTFSFIRGS